MKISIQRIISGVVLVALLIVIVPAVSYVSTVFGWTNPIVNPPGGAGAIMVDPVTGNVGVAGPTASTTLTVNGEISVSNNRIRNLTSPIDGNDAVNKDYLLASGAGGKGTITVYGVGSPITGTVTGFPSSYAWFSLSTSASISNCTIGDYENCGVGPFLQGLVSPWPAPGVGAACPANYHSIFAGYGPYTYLERNYWYPNFVDGFNGGKPNGDNAPPATSIPSYDFPNRSRVSISYSLCGTGLYQVAKTDYTISDGAQASTLSGTGAIAGFASACVPQQVGPTKYYICNTCNICEQD